MKIKKTILYLLIFASFFLIGFLIANKERKYYQVKRTQIIFGTLVQIEIFDEDETKANIALNEAFKEIKRIDSLFSTYNPNSSLARLNNCSDSVYCLDAEVYELFRMSDYFWKITNGAFDISLENINTTWGFNSESPAIPSRGKIQLALTISGWGKIELKEENTLKRKPGIKFNLGGIVEGYAADKSLELLKKLKIDKALINAGGEIRGFGENYIIGIQHPRDENKIIAATNLNGKAIATSGDYEKYFIENGKRYNHIFNPKTGYPATDLQSVTIIADSGAEADALSTAVFVLGTEEGLKLIEKLKGVEAMIIDSNGNKFYSSGFKNFLQKSFN
jgi:thiamine biosynthesis lipoprotein